jgi:hypothetical protein
VVFATWRVVVVDGATGVAKAMVPAPAGPTAWETKQLGTHSTMSAWGKTEAIHPKMGTSPVLLLGGAVAEVPAESLANTPRVGLVMISGLAIKNQLVALGIEMCTLQTRLCGHRLMIGKRTTTMMTVPRMPMMTKASVVNGSPFPGYPPTVTTVVKNNDCSSENTDIATTTIVNFFSYTYKQ